MVRCHTASTLLAVKTETPTNHNGHHSLVCPDGPDHLRVPTGRRGSYELSGDVRREKLLKTCSHSRMLGLVGDREASLRERAFSVEPPLCIHWPV